MKSEKELPWQRQEGRGFRQWTSPCKGPVAGSKCVRMKDCYGQVICIYVALSMGPGSEQVPLSCCHVGLIIFILQMRKLRLEKQSDLSKATQPGSSEVEMEPTALILPDMSLLGVSQQLPVW